MKRFSYLLLLVPVLLVWQACSTNKNTWVHRTYHNTTSYYNILFNGKEAYKKGILQIETAYRNDYTQILPIYRFGTQESSQSGVGDMDLAIQKCSKIIKQHSLRVKPKMKKKGMSKSEREFFKKSEYNKWIDDSYLLMGKAYLHQMEYTKAALAFQVILRKFPKTEDADLANLWLWRTYNEQNDFIQGETYMNEALKSSFLKKEYAFELFAQEAEYNLRQERFEEARKALLSAVKLAPNKTTRFRIQFILAQTYLKEENFRKASQLFGLVAQKSNNYDLAFNARIQQAISFDEGAGDYNSLLKELNALAKDEKNVEYLDRIYLAIATAATKKGKTNDAISNYHKALDANGEDRNIKAEAHHALANIYLEDKQYELSGAYYDSTMQNISPDREDYLAISEKAKSLIKLAQQIQVVHLQDSLQQLAKMSESDRNAVIDQAINVIKTKEAEQARIDALDQANSSYDPNRQPENSAQAFGGGGSGWYFYNSSSLSYGDGEFKRKWGNRKLADHWRRKNKSLQDISSTEEEDENNPKEVKDAVNDPKNRNYYLQNLPKTEADFAKSDELIQEALLTTGNTFKNDVKDIQEAINAYTQLVKRYPNNDLALEGLYNLYQICLEVNNPTQAANYKNQIITRFPNSSRAKALSDPAYAARLRNEHKLVSQNYDKAFALYEQAQPQASITILEQILREFPNNHLHARCLLLKAMCRAKALDMQTYKQELKDLLQAYPNDEITPLAKRMLDVAEVGKVDGKRVVQDIYFFEPGTAHQVALVCNNRQEANQLKFELVKLNSNLQGDALKIDIIPVLSDFIVLVSEFTTAIEAEKYRINISDKQDLKDKSNSKFPFFIISNKNWSTLNKDLDLPKYIQFYTSAYGQ